MGRSISVAFRKASLASLRACFSFSNRSSTAGDLNGLVA